jgi:hypothetical protein
MDPPNGSIKYEMAFLYKQENAYILLSAIGLPEPERMYRIPDIKRVAIPNLTGAGNIHGVVLPYTIHSQTMFV